MSSNNVMHLKETQVESNNVMPMKETQVASNNVMHMKLLPRNGPAMSMMAILTFLLKHHDPPLLWGLPRFPHFLDVLRRAIPRQKEALLLYLLPALQDTLKHTLPRLKGVLLQCILPPGEVLQHHFPPRGNVNPHRSPPHRMAPAGEKVLALLQQILPNDWDSR